MNKISYQEELSKGFIGQVEYKLHKDKSWIAQTFKSIEEKDKIIKELKKDKYKIDLIRFF